VFNNDFLGTAFISGFTLTFILSVIIGLVLYYLNLKLVILLMLLLITIVVIFQDSLKNSPLQDLKPKDAPPTILTNLFDAYTIDNSIKGYKIPEYESKILIHLLARFIGPLIFPPNRISAIERLIIYWNSEITNLFESYSSRRLLLNII